MQASRVILCGCIEPAGTTNNFKMIICDDWIAFLFFMSCATVQGAPQWDG